VALTLHGLSSILPIYCVLLLNGTVRAFNGPAGQAFLPLLVPEEDFPKAVAWNSSIFQAATIAGPVVGGLLYGWTGSPTPVYASRRSNIWRRCWCWRASGFAPRQGSVRRRLMRWLWRACDTSGATS
jgi:MFS family permease